MRRALENFLAFLLCHASQYAEDLAFAGALEILQTVENLLLRLVANAAGIVEHQIGGFRRLHLVVALCQQGADDFFRVMRIHLATEGFDVEGFPRHYGLF